MVATPAPLRDSRFRPFFFGRLVSMLGDSMGVIALSLAVLGASGRPSDLGIVLAAQMLPRLLLLLLGGVVADRWSRRTLLIWSSLGSAVTQGVVAGILITGRYDVTLIAVMALLNGAIDAFASPALRGIVPEVIPADQIQQANSLLSSSQSAVRIAGPTLAALISAKWGGGWAVAVDAASFVAAAAWLARVPLSRSATPAQGSLLGDARQGWTILRSLPWAMTMITSFAALNLVNVGPWNILGADITSHDHGQTAWGLTLSVRAIGLLVAGIVMYKLTFRRPLLAGRIAGIVIGLPLICMGLRAPLFVTLVAVVVAGLGFTCAAITWETTLQTHVPQDSLSRVAAYDDLLSLAAIPLGQIAVGPLASHFGSHVVALVSGIALCIAASAPALSRSVRDLGPESPHPSA